MFGFYRIAAAVPAIVPGDVRNNCAEIIRLYQESAANGAALVVMPRLSLTGASCGELFFHRALLDAARQAVDEIAAASGNCALVFGTPWMSRGKIYDCSVTVADGRIVAVSANEDGDKRFFSGEVTDFAGYEDFAETVVESSFNFALHTGGNSWHPAAEVQVISAGGYALPGTAARLRELASVLSGNFLHTVVITTGCAGESTAGNVAANTTVIASGGRVLETSPLLQSGGSVIYADVDMEALRYRRRREGKELANPDSWSIIDGLPASPDLQYSRIVPAPYLPESVEDIEKFCSETLDIQSFALAHRMRAAYAKKMILGISGGLDSTLALVVLNRTCKLAGLDTSAIVAVTMPGFGTTGRTKNNALLLAKIIGADVREIPIAPACEQHFRDIGHDPAVRNAVYENTQARERTQILMDIANAENGLVIGTGDLSEISMGWCTYNGDQMSMYSLNSTVMKSVIPELLKYEAGVFPEMAEVLLDVIATPVSPELLPAEDGAPGHKTEEILGAYEIHDFFIYHFCFCGAEKEKVLALAEKAFAGKYEAAEIARCYSIFSRRFFSQQFKRSASPEGVNANMISLNPGEWRMPSDVCGTLWKM